MGTSGPSISTNALSTHSPENDASRCSTVPTCTLPDLRVVAKEVSDTEFTFALILVFPLSVLIKTIPVSPGAGRRFILISLPV